MRRVCLLACLLACAATAQQFRAGAARVEITPAKDVKLRMSGYGGRKDPFQGIHDSVYVRAIALEDGSTRAAIVVADLIGFGEPFWKRFGARLLKEFAISPENLLLAGTHTHAAPSLGRGSDDDNDPGAEAYARDVENKLVEPCGRRAPPCVPHASAPAPERPTST